MRTIHRPATTYLPASPGLKSNLSRNTNNCRRRNYRRIKKRYASSLAQTYMKSTYQLSHCWCVHAARFLPFHLYTALHNFLSPCTCRISAHCLSYAYLVLPVLSFLELPCPAQRAMSRLHLFVYLCTNLLVVFVHGGIIYKVCNQAQSAQLDQAIQDVVEMAQSISSFTLLWTLLNDVLADAKDRLSDSPMLSQTSALWDVLYFPADLSTVKRKFDQRSKIDECKAFRARFADYC